MKNFFKLSPEKDKEKKNEEKKREKDKEREKDREKDRDKDKEKKSKPDDYKKDSSKKEEPKKGDSKTEATKEPKGKDVPEFITIKDFDKPPVYTPKQPKLIEQKLTIILMENSAQMAKENHNIAKMANSLVGLVSIIRYGKIVEKTGILQSFHYNNTHFQCSEEAGDEVCFYDALIALEQVISENLNLLKIEELKRTKITKIDIIGIGTCTDNCSVTEKEKALEAFSKKAKLMDVTTKYFCISEDYFMNAAETGFHSIGSLPRNYQ